MGVIDPTSLGVPHLVGFPSKAAVLASRRWSTERGVHDGNDSFLKSKRYWLQKTMGMVSYYG